MSQFINEVLDDIKFPGFFFTLTKKRIFVNEDKHLTMKTWQTILMVLGKQS